MEREPDQGYFPKPAKSLFIVDNQEENEATRRGFEWESLNISYVDGERYLRAYLGTREDLEYWVLPKVEAWAHGVCTLAKMFNRYPQSAYAGLGMSIHLHWQYLQRNFPMVGSLMGPI